MARGIPRIEIGSYQFKASQVGFAGLTIVMLVVLLASLGGQLRAPFPLELVTDNLNVISAGKDGVVLIDSQNSRLSVADSSGQVQSIANVRPNVANGEKYSGVFVSGDTMYYSTSKADSDSAYIASEQVYAAPLFGGERTLIYQQEYDASQRVVNPLFMKIAVSDGNVNLLRKSVDASSLEVVSLVVDPGAVIASKQLPAGVSGAISSSYDAKAGRLAIISNFYELYVGGDGEEFEKVETQSSSAAYTKCAWGGDGCLYCVNPFSNMLDRVDPLTGETTSYWSNVTCVSVSGSTESEVIACGTNNGFALYRVADFAEGSFPEPYEVVDSLPYSPWLAFTIIIEWVAIVYLTVCLIVILVRLVLRMLRKGQANEIVRGALVTACIAILIGVSAFYSVQFYRFTEDTQHDTVASLCEVCANTVQVRAIDAQEKIANQGGVSQAEASAAIETVGAALSEHCAAFADNSIGISLAYVLWSGDDVIVLGVDAQEYGYRHMAMDNPDIDKSVFRSYAGRSAGEIVRDRWSDSSSTDLVAYRAVYGTAGQIIGLVIVYCEISNMIQSYVSLCIELAMTLLAIAGAIVLIALEGKGTIEAFRKRREEKKKPGGKPEVWGMRPLVFLVIMASGFDGAMCVLVAREMLEAAGFANAEVLAGVPAMAASIGGFVGNFLYGFVAGKVSTRKLFVIGSAVGVASLAVSFFAVLGNAFWLYCLCKLVMGVGLYLVSSLIYSMPFLADNEKTRSQLFQDATMAGLSGNAMGGLICGYVAQYLGNSWIYAFNALPVIIMLVLGMRLLPAVAKQTGTQGGAKGGGAKKSVWAIFASPAVLALLVFVSLPAVLAGGYKSVLFPLFMDAGGLSKVYINNIVVFTNVLVFIVSPQINRALKGLNQWVAVLVSLLFCAAVLCWFMVNTTPLWGILALVLLSLSLKVNIPIRKLLPSREAKSRGLSEAGATNSFAIAESLLSSLKSPVLSALTVLGQSVACLCLGIVCAAGAGLFALITARTPMRGKEEPATRAEDEDRASGEEPANG